jgi:hypothetical protein
MLHLIDFKLILLKMKDGIAQIILNRPDVIYRGGFGFFSVSAAFAMYITLGAGAANLVSRYGSMKFNEMFLEKMVPGE